MAAATQVTLAEYLASDYHPDREYVDGQLLERNVGQGPHSYVQIALGAWFYAHQKRLGLRTLSEQRVQVSETNYRIPDLCVVRREDFGNIIHRPPVLCIEILSPEDRWNRLQESINDYLQFGVPEVWVIDPFDEKAWTCTLGKMPELFADNILRWNDLTLNLHDVLPAD